MKNGKLTTIIVITVFILLILIFQGGRILLIEEPSIVSETKAEKYTQRSDLSDIKENILYDSKSEMNENFGYTVNALKLEYSPKIRIKVLKMHSKYKFYGGGGIGKILNKNDDVIMESNIDQEDYIFNVNLSPDQNKILIYKGGINYMVYDSNGEKMLSLPEKPTRPSMLGFHSWHWVDDNKLVGVAYKLNNTDSTKKNIEAVCGCGDPSLAGSSFYIYNLSTEKMSAAKLPQELKEKILLVNIVDARGNIQLLLEDHTTHENSILGWFELE